MPLKYSTCLLLSLNIGFVIVIENEMEGRIVNGKYAPIETFSYSVYLMMTCNHLSWVCGGSILNQRIVLTAGHCVYSCLLTDSMILRIGASNKVNGKQYAIYQFKQHEHYAEDTMSNDIALVKTKQAMVFGRMVTRCALARTVPYRHFGSIAGWGVIDAQHTTTDYLNSINNIKMWPKQTCAKYLGDMPTGSFCAGYRKDRTYPAQGDSGSALIIKGYIQVGLVSCNIPDISNSLTVLTSIPYHHRWITANSRQLFCQ